VIPDGNERKRVAITVSISLLAGTGRLVFLDETWTTTSMTRLRGSSLRGERLVDRAPHNHWKSTTFLAALRIDGLTAPLVFDGPVDGSMFLA
jgi:hypothetical protein